VILTVTLNFALDVTYRVDRLDLGETMRVNTVARQAGGKGVNVARVLHALGREVAVTGLAGGWLGEAARAELDQAGLADETVFIAADSRQTVIVVDRDGAATGFSERGPAVTHEEWQRFLERYRALAARAEAVVLAGSHPAGLHTEAERELVAAAGSVPVLLDTDGEPLRTALGAGPTLVKINHKELAGVVGHDDVIEGARELQAAGAGTVIISRGVEGLIALSGGEILRAAPPEPVHGNPTGAGDAASAALIAALVDGRPLREGLADAAALSAAAVAAPVAGRFDAELYERLRSQITAG
jgi:tagatose 6-phosphate kinase